MDRRTFEKDIARYRGIIDGLVGDKPLTKESSLLRCLH